MFSLVPLVCKTKKVMLSQRNGIGGIRCGVWFWFGVWLCFVIFVRYINRKYVKIVVQC